MPVPGGSAHYKGGKIEPIELIEANNLSFHIGNVVKYCIRAEFYKRMGDRATMNDALTKAIWYLERYKTINNEPSS